MPERKYNDKLIPTARVLRKRMTPEEKRLWYEFLKKLDVTIKRQHVIGSYIVDFYYPAGKLVIELDGSQHYENDRAHEKDIIRDKTLNDMGYIVKRYSNRDIHKNFEGVCRDIHITIYGYDWD